MGRSMCAKSKLMDIHVPLNTTTKEWFGVTVPCSQESNSADVDDEIEWDSDFEDFEFPPVKVSKSHSPEIPVSSLLVNV